MSCCDRNDGCRLQLDLLEVEEVFPAVALQVTKLLSMDNTRVNCYGGSSALGLPIGKRSIEQFHVSLSSCFTFC